MLSVTLRLSKYEYTKFRFTIWTILVNKRVTWNWIKYFQFMCWFIVHSRGSLSTYTLCYYSTYVRLLDITCACADYNLLWLSVHPVLSSYHFHDHQDFARFCVWSILFRRNGDSQHVFTNTNSVLFLSITHNCCLCTFYLRYGILSQSVPSSRNGICFKF